MAEDETRFIGGDQARRLRRPGQAIIENPGVLERNFPPETDEGIPSPPAVVETTPTAAGSTPAEEREVARRQAEQQLRSNTPEEGDQGRSPDPRRGAGDQNTGSSALYDTETADARREGDPTAAREAAPARPRPPHYFVERPHQVYYHDVLVYIEGQDVSDYLIGSVSVTYGLGSAPNKCDFRLDNAGHKFTLTPENLQQEEFRTVTQQRGLGSSFDYAETAKKEIFDRKKNPSYNPIDPESGGRRFPLHHWSTVFHKKDTVRVWIHNPASEADEWLPVFTGYVIAKPISEDYITGSNTISVSCADIRYFMAKMRVNTNSVLAVLPGQQATSAADPTNRQPFTGLRVFSPQSNVEFDRSFFQDLVVQNNYENPWSALTFRQLVAALTFLENSQRLVQNQNGQVERRIEASRREDLNRLSREISPLQQRLAAGQTLTRAQEEHYNLLKNEIEQLGGSISDSGAVSGGDAVRVRTVDDISGSSPEREVTTATRETDPSSTPDAPPGAEGAGVSSGTEGGRLSYERAVPRGAGRIGRMRPGVYPTTQGAHRPAYAIADSIYPSVGASQDRIRAWWQGWYRLCLFGSPIRTNVQSTQFAPSAPNLRGRNGISISVSDGPLDHSMENRRYWTEDEVRDAGVGSRREGAWQCDAQAVHMILPSERAPTSDLIFGAGIISNSNVSQNLNWTNRLQLLTDACETVDYRFWVSGTGDLVFEFPQYDFDPRDYGPFEEVLTLDHHLKNETFDEEGGEIVTAVVANGSYVGRRDVQEPSSFNQFIPRSVGTWSPSLASRHGLNVKVLNYSQITSLSRLRRLALLEFQKLLAAADEYQIGIAFRPWLLLNKPIFNKYRERYALIDGIRWTLPVTAGSIAGHTVPTYNLTLNYTRSIDELGIPRFITGGPSQPMYYGARPEGRGNLLTALSQRIDSFSQAVQRLRSQENPVTTADLIVLRKTYNALVPQRQDSYNVINAALQQSVVEGRSDGAPSTAVQALQAASEACQEVIDNAGALSDDQRRDLLRQCEEQANAARDEIRREGRSTGGDQSPDGETTPSEGISGVRSTLGSESAPERPAEGPPPPEELCYPGDPDMYSAPLGRQSLPGVPRFNEWSRQLGRDLASRRRQILDSFGRGQVENPFEGLTAPVGLWQEQNAFPRVVTSGFGKRGRKWHTGVDLPATLGDPVYACQDGIVIQSSPGRTAGGGLAILHSGGYVTFYRHLGDRLVEIGDLVKRNQQIATVGLAGREPIQVAETHLHFECSAISGSPAFEQYVGDDRRWKIILPPQRDQLVLAGGGSSSTDGRERLAILDATVSEGRDLGSVRIISNLGSRQTSLATVSADLRDRFNLTFLRHRRGSDFTLPNTFMHYNPSCVGTDPFSGAELRGSTSREGGDLISQRDYYSQFNLKGIPSVTQPVIPTGSRFGQQEVPEIPSNTPDRRRRRLERQREAIITQNTRNAERQAAAQARLDAQIALYNDAAPPEECPPERYEGEIPRQPGEPLPDRQRISRAQAAGAYRRRASLSGDS